MGMQWSNAFNLRLIVYPFLVVLAVIIGLQLWVEIYEIPIVILPAPSEIIGSLVRYSGLLFYQSLITLQAVIMGFLVGMLFGIGIAILMFYSMTARDAAYPILIAFQVIPRVALAPLFIIWFGFGLYYRTMMTFFVAFFPVIVSSIGGFMSVEPEEFDLFRSLNASSWISFRRLLLPTALPEIFNGLKVSITLAMIGAIVAEFVAGNEGLGHLIITANQTLNTPLIFAGIAVLTVIGLILYGIMELIERISIPWFYLERRKK